MTLRLPGMMGLALAVAGWLFAADAATAEGAAICEGFLPGMSTLDASKYFSDPAVASFVDAVQRGNLHRVKEGLAAGISPDAPGEKGFRPIYFVFFAKDAAVLRLLLAAGADPNRPLENGGTPLHFAVRNDNTEFTRLLLAAGADPNGRGLNHEPHIHEAIYQENAVAQVKLLAAAGADLNVVWGGGTPLMRALGVGQWVVGQLLIDLGADLGSGGSSGRTALDRACAFIRKVPVNRDNRKGISGLVQSLARRNATLPCAEEVEKFK